MALASGSSGLATAQDVAVKTNIIGDALLSPNLGVEVGLAPRWTIDVTGEVNAWTVDDHKWKHWFVRPEARYWLCQRFAGHFFGVHAIAGQYNIGNIGTNFSFLGTDFSNLRDMDLHPFRLIPLRGVWHKNRREPPAQLCGAYQSGYKH